MHCFLSVSSFLFLLLLFRDPLFVLLFLPNILATYHYFKLYLHDDDDNDDDDYLNNFANGRVTREIYHR